MTHSNEDMVRREDMARELDAGRLAIMQILQRGVMTAEDVQRLRRDYFSDGDISQDEAEGLFAIERAGIANCPEWLEFFVEAITSHVVWEMRPTGVVNNAQGEWLLDQVDRTRSIAALAALINILAEAHRVPAWLPAAARGRAAAGWAGVDEALEAARNEVQLAA